MIVMKSPPSCTPVLYHLDSESLEKKITYLLASPENKAEMECGDWIVVSSDAERHSLIRQKCLIGANIATAQENSYDLYEGELALPVEGQAWETTVLMTRLNAS